MEIQRNETQDRLYIDDCRLLCDQIADRLKDDVFHKLKRRGAIVGISGGIDSSVTLALAVRALGADKVTGVMLPERDSNPESLVLAQQLAEKFGVKTIIEDISGALQGFGCYKRRDDAIACVIPEFNPETDRAKIVINQDISKNIPSVFSVTTISATGEQQTRLLPVKEYLQIVASTNFKQRSRMAMLYYHAERLHYAVIGTPNKAEVDQGFFVKFGDGGADVMPIAHLYKTQVYQLAEFLEIPSKIIERTPTTDTYTAEQTQEEFFYQLPFKTMDIMWHAWEKDYSAEELAKDLDKTAEEIRNIYSSFERKRKTTEYLRMPPIVYKG